MNTMSHRLGSLVGWGGVGLGWDETGRDGLRWNEGCEYQFAVNASSSYRSMQ